MCINNCEVLKMVKPSNIIILPKSKNCFKEVKLLLNNNFVIINKYYLHKFI